MVGRGADMMCGDEVAGEAYVAFNEGMATEGGFGVCD